MFRKPFRPPLLNKQSSSNPQPFQGDEDEGPAVKRRRLSPDLAQPVIPSEPNLQAVLQHESSAAFKQPTFVIQRSASEQRATSVVPEEFPAVRYNVLWRSFQAKKHKTWDGDGILTVANGYASLRDTNGKEMGRAQCAGPLLPETTLSIGSKEVQIEAVVSREESSPAISPLTFATKPRLKELEEYSRTNIRFNAKIKETDKSIERKQLAKLSKSTRDYPGQRVISQFKNPLKESTVLPKGDGEDPTPRHDANVPGALVMKRPMFPPKGRQIVDVVVDPILTKNLREHQRTGIQFLYECVMGMRPHTGDGAILADEMGLGKTLQVIALLWTLLKQTPVHGDAPVIKKALIVCPVTLISNWKREFRKWLGSERIGVFVLDEKRNKLTDFTLGKSYPIMIIGYEKLRTVQQEMQKGTGVDIVIADEGHRLKTAKNKTAQALKSLPTTRKIILSGTPVQNDLSEFYFAVDLINPGLLGRVNTFKREFENPILRSRQPDATEREVEKGQARSEELIKLTSLFMLRRTSEILAEYLPKKSEYILFCRPTSTQASAYRKMLSSSTFSSILNTPEATLQLIGILKKLCNSPNLLQAKENPAENSAMVSAILQDISPSLPKHPGASGKLQVLDSLLHGIRTTTEEKVVVVSHYTATLDILETLMTSLGYRFLRLDGATPQSKRQEYVEKFNRTNASTYFVFLLSAKSGGVGLNLTGASRLVLFDCDWNPSNDLQAMARIHRDGQTRPCKIYRLLTQGAMDEKIYQRQLTKLSLADSVVDNKASINSFTTEELRDLFSLDESASCQTHELLGCDCGGTGRCHDSGLVSPAAIDNANVDVDAEDSDKNDAESDEESLPSLPQLLTASQVHKDGVYQSKNLQVSPKKGTQSKKRMQMALMGYRHFDVAKLVANLTSSQARIGSVEETSLFSDVDESEQSKVPEDINDPFATGTALDDEVLTSILQDSENRVSYIFTKTFS